MNHDIERLKASMMYVKGGSYVMGDTHRLYRPILGSGIGTASVILDDFHIASCPVTNAQWDAVTGDKSSGEPRLPKTNVTWHEVISFILKLNEMTNWNFRLPTECEWEYAARGGDLSHDTLYSGSTILDSVGWYRANSHGAIRPVGMLQSNELGLYDMSGNVKEWCADIYGSQYEKGPRTGLFSSERMPVKNPRGALSGNKRSIRGGSYRCDEKACWVFFRDKMSSDSRAGDVGFRLAY